MNLQIPWNYLWNLWSLEVNTAMEETYVAHIALSHDMYKYIMNKVFDWGIKKQSEKPARFNDFFKNKNQTVDTNNHNVPEFSTKAELECYSCATNKEELQKRESYSGKLYPN